MEGFSRPVTCPQCGDDIATREVDTLDTFMDSSWYYLRYLDPHNIDSLANEKRLREWLPVDIYVGGMEHAIMHLLYARFVHKVICDSYGIEDATLREPFRELIVQGLVKGKTYKLKETGRYLSETEVQSYAEDEIEVTFEKMSKSKGNGVSPQIMAKEFGVDTLRSAVMFGAPPEHDLNFDISALQSTNSYLGRVRKLAEKFKSEEDVQNFDELVEKAMK